MRGTLALRGGLRELLGIIPAYAGNTQHGRGFRTAVWDHPRVCGEHSWRASRAAPMAGSSPRMRGEHIWTGCMTSRTSGSSPRMRGTHYDKFPQLEPEGIIPAYAGNTRRCWNQRQPYQDHPRVCGEHFFGAGARPYVQGSSPRMRGTLFV